jgi:hypothetical protein
VAKYTSPGKYLAVVHHYICLLNKPVVETAGQYLLGCLHIAESLARMSNTPTVVKQLNAGHSGRKLEEERDTYK